MLCVQPTSRGNKDKLKFLKIQNFSLKDAVMTMKRQATNWDEVSENELKLFKKQIR